MTDAEQAELLGRLEARLERIEDKMTRGEAALEAFLAGPGKKLMRLFGGAS